MRRLRARTAGGYRRAGAGWRGLTLHIIRGDRTGAQFAAPGSNLTNPEFGMITSTLNDGRTFRFLVSFDF